MHNTLKQTLLASALTVLAFSSTQSFADDLVVRVGTEPSFAPFEFMDEKTRVEIHGNVHKGYDKDKNMSYPYILVTVVDKVDESMTRSVNFD